ncbi:MAG TPA: 3-dehydroquinate synthase [Longimicrobiales bacterium]|nr:3-dehydroquinate synthase [Longimicrobiales bacterium]
MTPAAGGDAARLSLLLPRTGERCEIAAGPGLLAELPRLLSDHAPAHAYAVIADANVAALYGEGLLAALRDAGAPARLYPFPAGERHKTTATWAGLVEALARDAPGRDACVIGLGGGVTCDLAGFVAATFLRGIPLVQVPTSLLAMVDAAIGGKAGVDLEAGKNLAGAFWQPRLVVADTDLLRTLPQAEIGAGLAEAVKHGAIADEAAFAWLEAHGSRVLAADAAALGRVVADSIRVKAAYVAEDVREAGPRAALNFGHTIAHALERASAYALAHGPAVAIGMCVEARLGEEAGVTEAGTAGRLGRLVASLGLPCAVAAELDPAVLLEATRTDKKARRGAVRYTLLRGIGAVARAADGGWTHEAPDAAVLKALGGA